MNYRQKLGYILLGAGIMAVGITIGQFITPNIEAQSNGVFDEIQCRKLTVVDNNGKRAVLLSSENDDMLNSNSVKIFDQKGGKSIFLSSHGNVSSISLVNEGVRQAIELSSEGTVNSIRVHDEMGKLAIQMGSYVDSNTISIRDKAWKESFNISAFVHKNELTVFDKASHNYQTGIGFYADANEAKMTKWYPPKKD